MIYPYQHLPRYPGLSRFEGDLWDDFIRANPGRYSETRYDVLVGSGRDLPPGYGPEMVEMWGTITKKRIDVLCAHWGKLTIVEIKSLAGFTAIGQLIGYEILLKSQDPEIIVEDHLLIAPYVDSDIKAICEELSFSWWTPHSHWFAVRPK